MEDKPQTLAPLSVQNQANVVAFVLNVIVTFGAQAPFFPGEDNPTLSRKYQTLITPGTGAFAIWGVIFVLEGVFTIAQVTPMFRASPVINVITPFWLSANFFQVVWSFIFAQELFEAAFVIIFCCFLCLAGVLLSAETVRDIPWKSEWVLLTGFGLHTGWQMCAAAINFNVMVLENGANAEGQVMVAVVCLAAVLAGGAIFATALRRRASFLVPLVIAWASFFISQELREAEVLRDATREFHTPFAEETIRGLGAAAGWLSVAGLVFAGVAVGLRFRNAYSVQEEKSPGQISLAENAMGASVNSIMA